MQTTVDDDGEVRRVDEQHAGAQAVAGGTHPGTAQQSGQDPLAPEIVATKGDVPAGALPPLLVLDVVEAFLDAHGIGAGPVTAVRIGDGHSNLTFRVTRAGADVVLRRGPRPPLPRSAHDMVREARIQQSLAGQGGVPVPHILAVCDDADLLGVPFYVMDHLDGDVITEVEPQRIQTPQARRAVAMNMVDTLVALHRIDVSAPPVSDIGRPSGYLDRQVATFRRLWDVNTRRSVPDVVRVADLLAADVPATQRHAVVHGDYRLGNLMITGSGEPEVRAILDWEMATLGDPLADVGYLLANYSEAGSPDSALDLSPVTRRDGYPTAAELAQRYAEASGLDLSALGWYRALAYWKSAVFCEAMYTRYLAGERPGDDFAPQLEAGVPELARRALEAVGHG